MLVLIGNMLAGCGFRFLRPPLLYKITGNVGGIMFIIRQKSQLLPFS